MSPKDRDDFHARLTNLEELTNELQVGVKEVLDILGTAKAGFRVLGLLGSVLKWTASFAAACGALWAAVHQIGGSLK